MAGQEGEGMIQEIIKKNGIRVIYSPMKHLYKVQQLSGVWREIGQYKTYDGAMNRFREEVR